MIDVQVYDLKEAKTCVNNETFDWDTIVDIKNKRFSSYKELYEEKKRNPEKFYLTKKTTKEELERIFPNKKYRFMDFCRKSFFVNTATCMFMIETSIDSDYEKASLLPENILTKDLAEIIITKNPSMAKHIIEMMPKEVTNHKNICEKKMSSTELLRYITNNMNMIHDRQDLKRLVVNALREYCDIMDARDEGKNYFD